MRVLSVQIVNYKSHVATGPLKLGPITVLVGPNNAGKSSILQALYGLQQTIDNAHLRRGESEGSVTFELDGIRQAGATWNVEPGDGDSGTLLIPLRTSTNTNYTLRTARGERGVGQFPQTAPAHFIVPFLAGRKVNGYSEGVGIPQADAIRPDLHHLPARLTRLSNSHNPNHAIYANACERILGHVVTNVPSASGQRSGIYLDGRETIYLEAMGDGVPQIVGLIVELVEARDKLFLIEELENDLHPAALKELLALIVESSAHNQFVLTTHSHIVMRYLGAVPDTEVYNVTSQRGMLPPVAAVEAIDTPEARVGILRDLGYELSDFDLGDCWLILEESSAERIISSFLIPWFVPELQGRLRTVSAGGTGNVQPSFEDFRRLFLFTHLEHVYRGKAWVMVDGDDSVELTRPG